MTNLIIHNHLETFIRNHKTKENPIIRDHPLINNGKEL